MKRVVITGIGALTPAGIGFHESWEGVMSGSSGLGPITKFDASDLRWKIAGEIRGFDISGYLGTKEARRFDPFVHYAVAASIMAAGDAGLSVQGRLSSYLESGGVIIGSSRGGISTIEAAVTGNMLMRKNNDAGKRRRRGLSAYLMPSTTISMAASYTAQKMGIKGNCLGISNACASGANAIGEAFRLLRSGYAGPVLAGGAEAPVCLLCVEGYGVAGALSDIADPSACRPFCRSRKGFVIAEGAAVMVLEELDNALRRGSRIYCEIAGYGNTTDAYDQTRPSSEGEVRAVAGALKDANITAADIDYINAHGTATRLGDSAEAKTITGVFGKRASSLPVSALKSATGHMLAASAAFEAACTAMTIKTGMIPPTINLEDKDCDLNVITSPLQTEVRNAVSQSFGFGGVNAVLVIKKYEP